MGKRLTVNAAECTGCMRCEQACAAEHSRLQDIALSVFEEPEPSIFVEHAEGPVPLVCRHCREAPCVSACMAGCMQKDPDTGVVDNMGHVQRCVGCWMCIMACPYGLIVPSLDAERAGAAFPLARKCDLCPERDTPACIEACPMGVLELEETASATVDS